MRCREISTRSLRRGSGRRRCVLQSPVIRIRSNGASRPGRLQQRHPAPRSRRRQTHFGFLDPDADAATDGKVGGAASENPRPQRRELPSTRPTRSPKRRRVAEAARRRSPRLTSRPLTPLLQESVITPPYSFFTLHLSVMQEPGSYLPLWRDRAKRRQHRQVSNGHATFCSILGNGHDRQSDEFRRLARQRAGGAQCTPSARAEAPSGHRQEVDPDNLSGSGEVAGANAAEHDPSADRVA